LSEFARLVEEALAEVPEEFLPYLENVTVIMEEWATPEMRRRLGLSRHQDLYGLYQGTPLILRSHDHAALPDRILIFRGPLEQNYPEAEDLKREVTRTVIHEIAHHFGIGEERLRELGWG
jgi:predicted Zn-dependent protease with MMP-like domain